MRAFLFQDIFPEIHIWNKSANSSCRFNGVQLMSTEKRNKTFA
jgi:hypothetical protein